MAFRFRRRRRQDATTGVPERDASAIEDALERLSDDHELARQDFDLERLVSELFDKAPTADIEALRARGVTGADFYDDEIDPNWNDLDRSERIAKVEAFARLANVVSDDSTDDAGLGPLVRTKLAVLAWAYDHCYEDDLLERVSHSPDHYGAYDQSA